jgi:hypothetical protein
MTIEPRNLAAQLHHRSAGNPPSTLPAAAISNAFPGLEFDIRNLWRRVFVGIEVHESFGLVLSGDGELAELVGNILIEVDGVALAIPLHGPSDTDDDAELGTAFLEWSNALAQTLHDKADTKVPCVFVDPAAPDASPRTVKLALRKLFVTDPERRPIPLIAEEVADPGQLTQSLCSPWQNDYRECACYYWAASRPDYVNVDATAEGTDVGNAWMSRSRDPKRYTGDASGIPGQLTYEDLFRDWQGLLRFIVGGRDHD